MAERILCVDDDANILAAYQRQLRKDFRIDTASGGEEGLETIAKRGPYAVIVSDLRMPKMDGIQFLSRVREAAPDGVRVMLTGHADLKVAIEAVNEGHIFRFLTKPCPPETLSKALAAGVEQYRLVTAEKELLEKTLHGSIKVLTDILALVNPTAFGRASRVRRLVSQLAKTIKSEQTWQLEVAAMLSQTGCVTLPEETLGKIYQGARLSALEEKMFREHSQIGHDLIAKIPRMEEVAEMIAFQEKRFDGSGPPAEEKKGLDIILGARMLKLALDFDVLVSSGLSEKEALGKIILRGESWYDPAIVCALNKIIDVDEEYEAVAVTVDELAPDMIFADDVKGASGITLITKGQEVTLSLLVRLKNYLAVARIQEPIKVIVRFVANDRSGSN